VTPGAPHLAGMAPLLFGISWLIFTLLAAHPGRAGSAPTGAR